MTRPRLDLTKEQAPLWSERPLAGNAVAKAREDVCSRVGANIYGRVEYFLRMAEEGDDRQARAELLALLKFFPKPLLPAYGSKIRKPNAPA